MTPIKGIVVCVEYDDLLAITLPRNARHLTEIVVVTHPADERTKAVVRSVPSARVYETDAFYRNGARFNKGLAMEEGFDVLGRDGWVLVWDADTLLHDRPGIPPLVPGNLYGAPRRILPNPAQWYEGFDFRKARPTVDRAFPGFFQLFHADDPHIATRPWYDVTFAHAGGCDGYFESRWPAERKVRLTQEVLHLGPRDANWFGRASKRADGTQVDGAGDRAKVMGQFLAFKGWGGRGTVAPNSFEEHVEVPGHQPSGYKLRGRLDRS